MKSKFYALISTILNRSLLTLFFISISWSLKAVPLAGNYNVGSGQTYTTITAALTDLNANGVSAPVVFILTDASYTTAETFPLTIGIVNGSSSSNTVTIRPSSSSSAVLISSGNTTATFDFNGADFTILDGRAGGTGTTSILSIVNTSTSGVAIRLTNDANNNTITYCDVKGQNTVSVPSLTTAAGVIFINSAHSTGQLGNDKNTISYCNIHGTGSTTASFPTIGICAYGTQTTPATYNDSCTISNCNIYDIFNASLAATHIKIDLGNTAWNITDNHFYQSTAINYSGSTVVYRTLWVTPNVANINNAANGFIITGNFIGGNSASGSGTLSMTGTSTYSFWAMDLSVGLGTATSVQNNTITNIDMTTANTGSAAFEGINIANGNANVGTIAGNLIGSTTSTPGIVFTAIANTGGPIGLRSGGGTGNVINFSNNTIAGFLLNSSTSVAAIFNGIAASGGTTVNIINNTVGSGTVTNSINAPAATTSTSVQSIRGIILNGSSTSGTVSGNLIANMNTNAISTGTQTSSVVGIIVASPAGAYTISGNTIRNLSSAGQTSASGSTCAVIGIAYAVTIAPAIISNNIIHSLSLTHANTTSTTYLTGIYFAGPTSTNNVIEKNIIHSLSVTASDTNACFVKGIDIASGNAIIRNNMIRLGIDENGASVSKTLNLYGINEDAGVNFLYYNSVYLGGTVAAGSLNSYAFYSNISTATRDIKNNIFQNSRVNTTGIGKHYIAQLASISGLSINANNYYSGALFSSRIGSTNYTSLGLWQLATTQDSISVSVNSNFKNATGNATNVNLHIDTAGTAISFLESGAIAISGIANDYDGDARPGPAGSVKGGGTRPDIGADEFDGVPRPQCSNSTAGTTLSNFDTICVGNNVVLSLSGSTGIGVGSLYQWQSSVNNVTFSDISGANQNTYTALGISSTAYFRCIVSCYFGGSPSTSTSKKVTVINPQITATTPGSICGAGVVTLGATASLGVVTWYANATGGSALDTGVVFNTPSISSTTTYYVTAIYNGCTSTSRTPVVATIKTIPSLTSVTPNSICGPGSMTLSATTSLGTIDWYTTLTGGSSAGTGLYFTTPSLTATTTYYVEVTASGCVSTSRTPVVATIIPLPTIASVTPAGTCNSGSVVLHATANAGTVYWYSASGGGSPLDTGTIFTTPVIFAPTTYYVEAHENVCVSASRTPVVASIYSNPNITGTTAASGCTGDKVTLGASASAGVINWYTSATGGTSIATGTSFTTPALTTTTTYYVDATANGCTSNFRTPAKATINPIPTITGVTPASSCGNASLTLLATASNGIISWYDVATGGTAIITGGTYTTPVLSTTTTYYVETKDNGCISTRTPVKATIRAIPTINSSNSVATCRPSSLNLSATTNNGIVRWYSVPFGGVVLATGNSFTTPVITTSTTYYVDAFDSGCVSTTRTGINATIFPSINKATTVNGFTITATANGINYQWVDCNNNYQIISGATSQSYTPTVNGNYAVILKNTNCTDTSACVPITKIGIDNILMNQKISVAPNPTKDLITIKVTSDLIGLKYNLTDIMGRVMMTGEIHNEQQQINLQNLRPGIYLLNVGDTQLQNFRIVKE